MTTQNGNIIGDGGGGVLDARLGALAFNGGTTQTHSLLSGSPAIDNGSQAIPTIPANAPLDDRLAEIEKNMIIDALRKTGGVQVRATELLGINQRSLWHRIKKHNIDVKSIKNNRF